MGYFENSFKEFKIQLLKEIKKDYRVITFHIKNICFLFIILFSTSILFLSFFKKSKIIHQLSKINLVLLLITIICIVFFDPLFETYKQIKWGYYAFILIQLGIFYTSKSNLKSKI
jgi:phosphatidylserine synthase